MRRVLLLTLLLGEGLGCGRVQTVFRGATSVFRASADAPMHDDPSLRADVRLSVHWVGHATTLIQLEDRMVITDPAITSTVGLLSKRIVDAAVTEFPRLDLGVVSHMHFDHLSYASLEALESRLALLAIPDGAFAYLPAFSFDAREAAHWSSFDHGGMRVTAVPARHAGWRYGIDASWAEARCGWVFEYRGLSVYFAGDTGYDEAMFRAIGTRFPKLDVALLPIAPMEPHALMGRWHMNPEEAVRAFVVLDAQQMVPMHFDTFLNSLDTPGTAAPTLDAAVKAQKVDASRVATLQIGERRVFAKH